MAAKLKTTISGAKASLAELALILNKGMEADLVKLLNSNEVKTVPCFPTRQIGFNYALGGGLPKGRVVEIFGPEASGKTTLALDVIANLQVEDPDAEVLYVDQEHALDPMYMKNIGVDLNRVLIAQPDYGEQALQLIENALETKAFSIIVCDSVASLTPKAEFEGEMEDSSMGLQARMMGKGLRKITPKASNSGTTVIFINQTREKLGAMFSNPETTPGGNALKFFASQRIRMTKSMGAATEGERTSVTAKLTVVKNKIAPPFRTAETSIIFGKGYDRYESLINLAIANNVLVQGGSWITLPSGEKIQGRANLVEMLETNQEFYKDIYDRVNKVLYMANTEANQFNASEDNIGDNV